MHNKLYEIYCEGGVRKWWVGKINVKNERLNKWERKLNK